MEENTKKSMTDEERLELAQKLDQELDDFINGLEKKPYTDGWPEDRWEEEMARHPFFMKKAPEPGEELHPLYEGLQQLKYDPNENTPEELALSYKEDGNFNFKHKNYRLAILSYTEGVKVKCGKTDIEAALLNNRSAAHYFLKNYRSSLRDSELALKLNPQYNKALVRAAHCCFQTEQFEKCLDYCDRILEKNRNDKEILTLRKDCINAQKRWERDVRKKEVVRRKKILEDNLLFEEILKRKIKCEENLTLQTLEPSLPALERSRVHLDGNNNLVWPVVLLYPEHATMDFIQEFPENDLFVDHLREVFKERADWDVDGKYVIENLNVYIENTRKVVSIDLQLSLRDILSMDSFVLKGGTPSFIVHVKGSAAEKVFLESFTNKI